LTADQLQYLLGCFEQFLTAEDVVAEMRRRKNPSMKPKISTPCDLYLHNTVSLNLQTPIQPVSSELVNPADITANLLKSLGLDDAAGSSGSAPSFATSSKDTDSVARLHEMFPHLQLSYLKTLISLTEGDFVYAAAIAAECKEQNSMTSSLNEVIEPPIKLLNLEAEEEDKQEKEKHEAPRSNPENMSAFLSNEEFPQESHAGSLDDSCQPEIAPFIRLSPHFLKSVYEEYASELGLPKLLLDFNEMPPEVFDEWVPDENISKQILLSFLGQLGCLKSDRKKNWSSRSWKPNFKFKSSNVEIGANNSANSNVPDLENIMAEESAIRLSVLEQKKHFEKPHARKALDKLVREYPGTDPAIVMETLVRCGFDVDAATACLVSGVLDSATFMAVADTSGFQLETFSTSTPPAVPLQVTSASGDYRTHSTSSPRLSAIIEEDESRWRSLASKSENKRTLAARLRLNRLADQFPSFTKSYLAELFAQFDFNEDKVRHHLESEGYKAQPISSLLPLKEIKEPVDSGSFSLSSVSAEAAQSLNLLELEVAELRENIKQMKTTLAKIRQTCTHPGVIDFYRDESPHFA
uniref:Smr domain-containing protein n=1 Tax=Hydatigena taeniaeformis TaxID=6205 RepID=A0A0R3WNH6_HYDTA